MGGRQPGPSELRDHLANERTFLAWVRTSITFVGLGFVVAKFGILLREVGGSRVHPMTARAGAVVGVVLVLGGILTTALAAVRFLNIRRDINRAVINFSPTLDIALAIVLSVVSVVLAVYIVLTA